MSEKLAANSKKLWALVLWVETKQVSVMSDKFIPDKEMLVDPAREGMVIYGRTGVKPPKDGWDSYRARVLASSANRSTVVEKEKEYITAKNVSSKDEESKLSDSDVEMEEIDTSQASCAGRNQLNKRKAEKAAMSSLLIDSEAEDEDGVVKKKKKTEQSDVEDLSKQVQANAELLRNIGTTVQQAVERALARYFSGDSAGPSQQRPTSQSDARVNPVPRPVPVPALPDLKLRQTSHAPAVPPPDPVSAVDVPSDEIFSFLTEEQSSVIQHAKIWQKRTCALMGMLFTSSQMSKSLVSGKRLREEDKGRPLLDQSKVQMIVGHITNTWPEVTPGEVRKRMAQKCKDVRAGEKKNPTK